MAFRDLQEVAGNSTPKVLPINGQRVEFPGLVSARVGTLLLAALAAGVEVAEAQGSADEQAAAISAAMEDQGLSEADMQLIEDEMIGTEARAQLSDLGIWGRQLNFITSTLMVWHVMGQEMAEAFWDKGPDQAAGKAPAAVAANRETRRRKAGSSSKGAGSAATRSRARTSAARPVGD